ncbi:YigZ family protein [Mycoplasmatota bacterium WC30]
MNSIREKTTNEIEIKKSKFIGVAIPVNNEVEIRDLLKNIRKEYVNANHYTYAYILGDLGNIQKASDDGEPTRTAGFPILDVLLKQKLTNIILIVIRYFGGTKLGAGGLIRAYSSSASEVIKKVVLTKKITTYDCLVTCSYDNIGNIDRYLREKSLLNEIKYDKDVTFFFHVTADIFEEVKSDIFNRNNYQDTLKILNESSQYA